MISAATTVIVHPLVLLSVTDHASRVSLSARKRCVGVLLGQDNGKSVNVANSFAVPFEEDENDPKTLFLDHDLSLIHISEPTRPVCSSRMPSSA